MGNFYVNITTRNVPVNEIVTFLKSKELSAYIIFGPGDYVTIYEEICDNQNNRHISLLLKEISKKFASPAIAFLNHDDDILYYELWVNGEKVDSYNSNPDYFKGGEEDEEMNLVGGNVELLSDIMGNSADLFAVKTILNPVGEEYIFSVERHLALVNALGMPDHSVGYGYRYLSQGEFPDDFPPEKIIKI